MNVLGILETDKKLLELLQDHGFAIEFYAAACNATWTHTTGGIMEDTFRGNGGWVAALRGLGENYLDFYGSGPEGTITDRVRTELTRLGWSWEAMK